MKLYLLKITLIIVIMLALSACQQDQQCSNGVKDGAEISVDCGGSDCAACPTIPAVCSGDGGTFVGLVNLYTQAQVDSFGAFEYNKIDGNLYIHSVDITDLTPLCTLKEISWLLLINGNIVDLNGLHNIERIGGYLKFEEISSSVDLIGFPKLNYVGEYVLIRYNTELKSITIDGLSNVSLVSLGIQLEENNKLTEVTISNFYFGHEIFILSSPKLKKLDVELENSLSGSVDIVDNDSLSDINFLDGLTNVDYLNIKGINIDNLDVLVNLTSAEYVSIGFCPKLDDFCGLNNLIAANAIDSSTFFTANNLYNPTFQNLQTGNCLP